MKVVFGLGNPGSNYHGTRHNIGYMAVNKVAKEYNSGFIEKAKFQAYVSEVTIGDQKTLLVKPTTFYNNVGQSARAIIDFYKLDPASDLIVIHDDLTLPSGTIRIRKKGRDAGNNGIKSLNSHLGQNYTRIRIGTQPQGHSITDDSSFVLSRPSSEESLVTKDLILKSYDYIQGFIEGSLEETSYTIG